MARANQALSHAPKADHWTLLPYRLEWRGPSVPGSTEHGRGQVGATHSQIKLMRSGQPVCNVIQANSSQVWNEDVHLGLI